MDQMDLFSGFEEIAAAVYSSGQTGVYTKWRMFEYLENLKGQTAKITYQQGEEIFYQIPIKLDSMYFVNKHIGSHQKDAMTLFSLVSEKSNMTFSSYVDDHLKRLEVSEGIHTFHYEKKVNNVWEPSCSKAMFELTPYATKSHSTLSKYDINGELSQLIGKTVQAKLRTQNDIVHEIMTLPFKILSVRLIDDQITIIGTNDTILRSVGFQGVRYDSELLIDINLKSSGYTQTIHLF